MLLLTPLEIKVGILTKVGRHGRHIGSHSLWLHMDSMLVTTHPQRVVTFRRTRSITRIHVQTFIGPPYKRAWLQSGRHSRSQMPLVALTNYALQSLRQIFVGVGAATPTI